MVAPISPLGGNPFSGMGAVSNSSLMSGSLFGPGLSGTQFSSNFVAPSFNTQMVGGIAWQPPVLGAPLGVQSTAPASGGQSSFLDTLRSTLQNANETLQKPDELLNDAVAGGKADVHDVMIANAKAELTVNIASQSTTKLVQAYDKITQIQV
jgi:flagellar hook-basal body complex protein FliE